MPAMDRIARATIRDAGQHPGYYSRRFFPDGEWRGDTCGCPDDRCIGKHHGHEDPCRCLSSLLADMEASK